MASGFACGNGNFHVAANRVLPSAGARAELANCAFLSIGWGAARGLASSMFPTFGCGLLVEKTAFLLSTVGRAYGWLPNVITKSCGQDNLIIMRLLLLASHNLCQHVFTEKLIVSPRVALTDYIILLDITPRAVGTARESMRPLANELPAARVRLASSAFPTFGYCPPQEVLRTAYGDSFVRSAQNVPACVH